MAYKDTPIREQEIARLKDTPITEQDIPQHSEETENFMAMQSSFIESYLNGSSPRENFNYYSGSTDKETELRKLSQQKAAQDAQDVTEEFIANPRGSTGDIKQTAEIASQAREKALSQGDDPDVQYAEVIAGPTGDISKAEKEGGRSKMHKMLADWQAEVGTTDMIMDIGKGFLPFLPSYRGYKLTGQYFGQEEELKKAVRNFRNMPQEEQEKIFPALKEELEEKVGDVAGVQILSSFLNPLGSEDETQYGTENKVFDAIDAGGLMTIIPKILTGAKRGYNVVKSMRNMDNDQGAVDAATATLADPELARRTNRDDVTRTGDALPFDTSIEDIGHSNELSGSVYNNLKQYFNEVDKTAEDIITGTGFLREGIINTKQRARLEADTIKKLKAEQAENMQVVSRDGNTTTFKYNILDEEGNITEKEYTTQFTLNDAGHWDQSEMSLTAEYAASPTAFAKGTLREDIDTAQRVDYLTARMNRKLTELTREALKPIGLTPTPKNKKRLAKVDKALREGDEWKDPATGERGKVFDPEELRSNYGMDDNEISAYYRTNRLYNNLWRIRNEEKRAELQSFNYKNIKFSQNGESTIGKAFDDAGTGSASLRENNINLVYDAELDEVVNVKQADSDYISTAYADQKVLTRLEEPYDTGGDRGKVLYALVSKNDVGELPEQVLRRKKGYVPRIYEDAAYFVKEVVEDTVDGNKTTKNKKTLRFFDNKKEADEFVEELVKDAVDNGSMTEKQARDRYLTLSDREEQVLSAAVGDVGHGTGGLYTGARAQDEILFGLNGDKPARLNSFESLTRNIANVSRYASVNQWRLGLEQRWINTANQIFKAKGLENKVTSFQKLSETAETSEEVRFLNKMHDQIREWQQFPTASERAWDSGVQKMYDWAARKDLDRTKKMIGSLRGKDPIAMARASAFHSFLGWFNFSQFWVQAQGAAQAAAIGAGKGLSRNFGNSMALTALDVGEVGTKRYEMAAKAVNGVAEKAGMTADEMKALHRLWEQTGYKDSVLQTADHAAVSRGYGMTSDIIKRTADRGLMFYRGGELFNRRLSFSTAVRRYMDKNNIDSYTKIGDDALKDIMDDANNMMLNMTKSNRAFWQKGFLSLPTQFMQVTTKFLETASGMNRNFTPAERGRMIAAQIGLYGTAGVPMAGLGVKYASEMMGMTQEDIEKNPGVVKTINDGMWGAMTHWVLGADMELSSRGSLMRGVSDFIDNWFLQESSVVEKLAGPFGATGTRFWDTFTEKMRPFTTSDWSNIDFEDGAELMTAPILDTISTWRNIEKAAYMEKLDAIYSKSGRVLDTRDYSLTEEWMQRLGFSHSAVSDIYELEALTQANDSLVKNITDAALNRMNEFALQYPDGDFDQKAYEAYQRDMKVLMGPLDPDEQMQVNDSITRSMTSGSRRAQAVKRYIDNMKENTTTDLENWKAFLLGSNIIRLQRLDGEEEE